MPKATWALMTNKSPIWEVRMIPRSGSPYATVYIENTLLDRSTSSMRKKQARYLPSTICRDVIGAVDNNLIDWLLFSSENEAIVTAGMIRKIMN